VPNEHESPALAGLG